MRVCAASSVLLATLIICGASAVSLFTFMDRASARDVAAIPHEILQQTAWTVVPDCDAVAEATQSMSIRVSDTVTITAEKTYFDTIEDRKIWLGTVAGQFTSSVKVVCSTDSAPAAVGAFLLEMQLPAQGENSETREYTCTASLDMIGAVTVYQRKHTDLPPEYEGP